MLLSRIEDEDGHEEHMRRRERDHDRRYCQGKERQPINEVVQQAAAVFAHGAQYAPWGSIRLDRDTAKLRHFRERLGRLNNLGGLAQLQRLQAQTDKASGDQWGSLGGGAPAARRLGHHGNGEDASAPGAVVRASLARSRLARTPNRVSSHSRPFFRCR